MAITVREIEEKVFRIAPIRGYSIGEVDDYLDEIGEELVRLQEENEELRAQVTACLEKEKRVAELEQTLRDTLITAQRAADDVMRASREKASAMIKDSELEGRRILEDSERQAQTATQRLESINRDVAGVKALIRRVLGEQLRLLEESYPDMPDADSPAEQQQPQAKAAQAAVPVLADFDQTQEFSVREVREQAGEETVYPRLKENYSR